MYQQTFETQAKDEISAINGIMSQFYDYCEYFMQSKFTPIIIKFYVEKMTHNYDDSRYLIIVYYKLEKEG